MTSPLTIICIKGTTLFSSIFPYQLFHLYLHLFLLTHRKYCLTYTMIAIYMTVLFSPTFPDYIFYHNLQLILLSLSNIILSSFAWLKLSMIVTYNIILCYHPLLTFPPPFRNFLLCCSHQLIRQNLSYKMCPVLLMVALGCRCKVREYCFNCIA